MAGIGKPRCKLSTERDGDRICTISVFPLTCEGLLVDRKGCPFWKGIE